jgi:arginyl-tRNA synthetase
MKLPLELLSDAVRNAVRTAFGIETDPLVAPSQNPAFGDFQSNVAMGLAKQVSAKLGAKASPRDVASQILAALPVLDLLEGPPDPSWIAGPGFINFRLNPGWIASRLDEVLSDPLVGCRKSSPPLTTVVDYSGVNIAKEMHVGHLRSTIIGDALSRVLAFQGHDVIRQNHLGDWGTQFGRVVLGLWYRCSFEHFGNLDALRRLMDRASEAVRARQTRQLDQIAQELGHFHSQYFDRDPQSAYFIPVLETLQLSLAELEALYQFTSQVTESEGAGSVLLKDVHGHDSVTLRDLPRKVTTFVQNQSDPSNQQEAFAWQYARRITLDSCRNIYKRLGVQLGDPTIQSQPLERGESFYHFMLPDVVRELLEKGIAEESDGAVVVFTDGRDKSPLIIRKGDGGYLYGTTDLAGIKFRVTELNAGRIIYTHDSRQAQHFAQVFAVAKRAGWANGVILEYAPFGTMLGEDGKPFKTRSGELIKLLDLLDEAEARAREIVVTKNPELEASEHARVAHAVGIGAVKYADLSKDRTSDYVFSWDKMLAMEGNTAPYLQYVHARICSIFRKAGENYAPGSVGTLAHPAERALGLQLLHFPAAVEAVARDLKPHLLCTYLYEVATRFSAFYEACPVLKAPETERLHRLSLCRLTARIMSTGLGLLGIEAPERM